MVNTANNHIKFSVTAYAAWIKCSENETKWHAWADDKITIVSGDTAPALTAMPSMLRRRVNMPGKMALEVAYRCVGKHTNIPTLFCSRHGECTRSIELLLDIAQDNPISPTTFSLSVHNANGGLFSIAQHEYANQIALAAGQNTIEHAVIEACSLLADGAPAVLLVAYDHPLPEIFKNFEECNEQAYAFAWLIESPAKDIISLSWSTTTNNPIADKDFSLTLATTPYLSETPGLEIFHFFISRAQQLNRITNRQHWQWKRHV